MPKRKDNESTVAIEAKRRNTSNINVGALEDIIKQLEALHKEEKDPTEGLKKLKQEYQQSINDGKIDKIVEHHQKSTQIDTKGRMAFFIDALKTCKQGENLSDFLTTKADYGLKDISCGKPLRLNGVELRNLTLVHILVYSNCVEAYNQLHNMHENDVQTAEGENTYLNLAIIGNSTYFTDWFLELDTTKKTLNAQDYKGMKPLLYAAQLGHKECMTILLKQGADSYVATKGGNTFLHLICRDFCKDSTKTKSVNDLLSSFAQESVKTVCATLNHEKKLPYELLPENMPQAEKEKLPHYETLINIKAGHKQQLDKLYTERSEYECSELNAEYYATIEQHWTPEEIESLEEQCQ